MTLMSYDDERMDWRSLFVFDPATGIVRIRGWFRPDWRASASAEMWRRRARWAAWKRAHEKQATIGSC